MFITTNQFKFQNLSAPKDTISSIVLTIKHCQENHIELNGDYVNNKDCIFYILLIQRDTRPTPIVNCRMNSGKHTRGISPAPDHRTEAGLRIDPKVLVFVESTYSQLGRNISELLVYNRIKF
uniref:Heparan sulfate-N-deacetylase N-terminal domain-containing protein n=1 Tax=Glossina brevipalpis TaxID=37001 RepID=A0A1A9W4A1_9MUSC